MAWTGSCYVRPYELVIHFTSFHILTNVLAIFICLFNQSHSCYSHAQVYELHICYSDAAHVEWFLLFSRNEVIEIRESSKFARSKIRISKTNYNDNNKKGLSLAMPLREA